MIASEIRDAEEGIFFGMPHNEYLDRPGLSHSGLKALAVSPLYYQHACIDKVAEEPSPQARFGSLVHCRLLEPKRFTDSYAIPPSIDAYPGALTIKEHLIAWLEARSLSTKHKVKADLIQRIADHCAETGEESPVIWDAIKEQFEKESEGKRLITDSEADRIRGIASVVANHKYASAMLSNGQPEVSIFVRDPNTGILLKARLDLLKLRATNDLKTFNRMRGETPDAAVARAFRYERYDRQGVFYRNIREYARIRLSEGDLKVHGAPPADWLNEFVACRDHAFGFVFVESEAPHHVVLREIRRQDRDGNVNLYWDDAELFIEQMIGRYAECVAKFGDKPWREVDPASLVSDLCFPKMVFKQPEEMML